MKITCLRCGSRRLTENTMIIAPNFEVKSFKCQECYTCQFLEEDVYPAFIALKDFIKKMNQNSNNPDNSKTAT